MYQNQMSAPWVQNSGAIGASTPWVKRCQPHRGLRQLAISVNRMGYHILYHADIHQQRIQIRSLKLAFSYSI